MDFIIIYVNEHTIIRKGMENINTTISSATAWILSDSIFPIKCLLFLENFVVASSSRKLASKRKMTAILSCVARQSVKSWSLLPVTLKWQHQSLLRYAHRLIKF